MLGHDILLASDAARGFRDLVLRGQARPVLPTSDVGDPAYGTGRLFSSTTAVVKYPTSVFPSSLVTAGTVAMRIAPTWAGNDGASHVLFQMANGVPNSSCIYVIKHTDNKFYVYSRPDAGGTDYISSAAQAFAANTIHNIVGRWTQGVGTFDLSADGTNAVQAEQAGTVTLGPWWGVGTNYVASSYSESYIGPVILSPSYKSNAWVDAIAASSGAVFSDPVRLFRDFMDVGDVIVPFNGDSVAYQKVRGGCPFEYGLGVYAGTEYTTATYGSGDGVISLRFDDCSDVDYSYVYPELTDRSLVAGFANVLDFIGVSGRMALADLLTMQAGGMEIMCHSKTHGSDPASIDEFLTETARAATSMRALGLDIASFVAPGTWLGSYLINNSAFWGTHSDQILRANFSAYEAYITPAARTLPVFGNNRYGRTHTTGDTVSLAALQNAVDVAAAAGTGLEVLFHPIGIGVAGHISKADFESFLDYLQTKAGTGAITVLTPTQQLYATVA